MTIKMILCTDKNGGLGKDGNLPWGNNYPEDLQYFKQQTLNSTVVMGRKTWIGLQKIGLRKGLPDRKNLVVTSQDKFLNGNQRKEHYIDFGVLKSKVLPHYKFYKDKIWIIGGKSIYEQLFPYVEEIHHSIIIDKEYDCDTFMDVSLWQDNLRWKKVRCEQLSDNVIVNVWRKI